MMHQLPQRVTLQLLRVYKAIVSPLFPPACRYVPTCSEYAMEAVDRFGVVLGGLLAVWRLLRCHPFVKGGYDPVIKRARSCEEMSSAGRPHGAMHDTI